MFKRKTVIVVGAGASAEVGLPAGEKFKTDIAEKLKFEFKTDEFHQTRLIRGDPYLAQAHELARTFSPIGTDPFKAAEKLRLILPQGLSIDTVLDNHNDDEAMVKCGKWGICSSIIQAERKSDLFHSNDGKGAFDFKRSENSWFHFFFMLLTEGIHQAKVWEIFQNTTFIVFNYDRCIEFYLREALLNYYKLDPFQVTSIVKMLKIFHPYGSIGELKWGKINDNFGTPFGSEEYGLFSSSDSIKTFTERVDDNYELTQMRKAIQAAETILFLGFAFHEQNMRLLSTPGSSVRNIYGTALNISTSDVEVIRESIRSSLNPVDSAAKIYLRQDLRCTDLFQEYRLSLMR